VSTHRSKTQRKIQTQTTQATNSDEEDISASQQPLDKKQIFLKKIPVLRGLTGREWEKLQLQTELVDIKKRRVVYLSGDPGESIYFVNAGRAKISKVTRDGREITLAYVGPGDIAGENCLFNAGPRREMLETVANSILTEIPRNYFERLLSKKRSIMLELYKIVADRRRKIEQRLEHLVFRDVNAKLADLILQLGRQYGEENSQGIRVGIAVTHQELANLIGSTRETVSLNISRFKRKGLVDTEQRKLIIRDVDGLRALL
jgi:CRP-like cAMP-binding protein